MDDTLCAWCGCPIKDKFVKYRGEIICCDCYTNREDSEEEVPDYGER